VPTRRDLAESYQFLSRRVVAAVVTGELDPPQSALRRGVGAFVAGIMVAVLVGAGFGVVGLFTQTGGNSWQVDGAVVVEKETGASFIFHNGVLYPALNYTSALLAAGKSPPTVFRESAAAIAGVAHGNRIGIPGAPDSLPAARAMLSGRWNLCAAGPVTTVLVGTDPAGGSPVADRALLVTDGATTTLLWHGHRNLVADASTVVPALFGALGVAHRVGPAFLSGLPAGPDIAAIPVTDQGAASPVLPGRHNGDIVYADTGSGRQYYLVLADGLAPITALQRDVQLSRAAVAQTRIDVAIAINAKASTQAPTASELAPPAATPTLASIGSADAICAAIGDPTTAAQVSVGDTVPAGGVVTDPATGGSADRVLVPPGHAAIVQTLVSPSAADGPYSLVTDIGVRYPVASPQILGVLGYTPREAVRLPATLVGRLPTGPTLDSTLAAVPG
jgi:type VII secretion protein EccB